MASGKQFLSNVFRNAFVSKIFPKSSGLHVLAALSVNGLMKGLLTCISALLFVCLPDNLSLIFLSVEERHDLQTHLKF